MKSAKTLFGIFSLIAVLAVVDANADCTPSPAGIVGWWKGDGNTIDSVSSNNGVAVNVTYTTGVVGQAFACNSVDYGPYVGVQVPDRPAYALTNSLTIEGWVRPRGDGSIIFWRGDNRPGMDPYILSMQHNNTVQFVITDANGNSANVETTLAYNQWIHLAATLDGASGTMRIYTNAMLAAQTVTSVRPFGTLVAGDSPGVGIGNLNDGQNNFAFLGDIDEISLYNRALLSCEITAIYNAGSSGKCVPALVTAGEPAIFNIAPTSGSNETVVTINGTNFSSVASSNTVYFGAVRAPVIAASASNLTVTVPLGATYAPITVTVNGLTAYSDQPFLPTFTGNGQINNSTLAARINLPTGSQPTDICIADLDGDGRADLLAADSESGQISIYQNISTNRTLAFAPRLVLPLISGPCCNPSKITVADLDGDGRLDIMAINGASNLVSVLRNTSSPGVLTTNSFASRMDIRAGNYPWGIAVEDLNGDGKPDIVVGNYNDNTISIFQNLSTLGNTSFAPGVSYPCGTGPNGLVIADLDGDGNPDIAVANSIASTISIFRNLGAGGPITTNSFAQQVVFAAPAYTSYVTIGDLDGDGKPDIIAACFIQFNTISVFRNITSGPGITANSFAPHVDFPLPGWGFDTALGDLDGDGRLDLAVTGQLNDYLSLFHNTSAPGSFTISSLGDRIDFGAGYNPHGPVIGDLNGDGKPDIVTVNTYDGNISIYLNNTPSASVPAIISQPQDTYVYASGTASFSVTATEASGYQWLFNGSNILNGTSSTLSLSNIVQSELGQYSVIVGNGFGSVTSSVANLFMYPSIITPFTGLVTDWGQNTTLSITAWGSGPLTFQWYDNGVALLNATNSTLTFSAIQFTNAGSYSVVVSSSLGSVTNTPAQVVVNPAGAALGMYPGITVTGTVGYTYIIQSDPDLSNTNGWTTVAILTLFQPVELWVDINNNATSPTNQHRFYRVLPGQ